MKNFARPVHLSFFTGFVFDMISELVSDGVLIVPLVELGMGDFLIAKNWLYYLNHNFGLQGEEVTLVCRPDDKRTIGSIFADCIWVKDIEVLDYKSSSLVNDGYDLIFRFSIFPYLQMMRDEKVYNRNKDLYFYADAVRKFGLENYMSVFFASPDFYKTVSNIFAKYPDRKYHTHFDVTGDLGAGDEYLCDVPIGVSETW